MSFAIKHRGAPALPYTFADYECPVHGRFEAQVDRTPEGDAPDEIPCPQREQRFDANSTLAWTEHCGRTAEYRISAPLSRVNPIEAVKGGWTKPERKTWLDTRNLGEGQSLIEFREDRERIREEKRKEDVMRFAREHYERPIGRD